MEVRGVGQGLGLGVHICEEPRVRAGGGSRMDLLMYTVSSAQGLVGAYVAVGNGCTLGSCMSVSYCSVQNKE